MQFFPSPCVPFGQLSQVGPAKQITLGSHPPLLSSHPASRKNEKEGGEREGKGGEGGRE